MRILLKEGKELHKRRKRCQIIRSNWSWRAPTPNIEPTTSGYENNCGFLYTAIKSKFKTIGCFLTIGWTSFENLVGRTTVKGSEDRLKLLNATKVIVRTKMLMKCVKALLKLTMAFVLLKNLGLNNPE